MWKFAGGVAVGALLAFGYVRFDVALPGFLQLPDALRGNIVSSATEAQLYDLAAAPDVRERALEIYLANRAADAARLDAEAGHPFLTALHRARARREARRVLQALSAFEDALAQPALRESLVRRYGVSEDEALKRRMLSEALGKEPFLAAWVAQAFGAPAPDALEDHLRRAARAE